MQSIPFPGPPVILRPAAEAQMGPDSAPEDRSAEFKSYGSITVTHRFQEPYRKTCYKPAPKAQSELRAPTRKVPSEVQEWNIPRVSISIELQYTNLAYKAVPQDSNHMSSSMNCGYALLSHKDEVTGCLVGLNLLPVCSAC